MRTKRPWMTALGAAALIAGALHLEPQEVTAADHIDAPGTTADAAADIADFYAWATDNGTVVAIVTFNAGLAPGDDAPWDSEVLYTIHIDNTAGFAEAWTDPLDNDNDNESDIQIHVRFAPSPDDDTAWAFEVLNAPGSSGPIVDWVEAETPITDGPVTAWAGRRDDPFFFDFDGFVATLTNATDDADPIDIEFASVNALGGMGLELTGSVNDTFAGSNTLAIVLEFDAGAALDGNAEDFLQLWATTGRAN